jgi:hypothetical protein
MNLQIENNKPIVNIIDDENILSFEFTSYDKNYLISQNDSNVRLLLKKQTVANLNISENLLEINFEKIISYIQFISLKFKFDSIIEMENNYIIFSRGNKEYVIDFQNTKYSFESNDILLIILDKPNNSMKVSELNFFAKTFNSQNFKAFNATNSFIIDDTCKMPEFSIGSYDDSALSIPRPVRQGNPVISTVPALIDTNSSTDDTEYYNTGSGPVSKTIYFKIFCNTIIENTLSAGNISPNLQLKVYLPNGLDTVKAPVYVDMYFVSSDTTNNISVYSASYTFYKQGRYNNIDYVDGFMYFDVHCPLTVQKSIPFQFDFQLL